MTDVPSYNPHKEEDEGYLAAENGRSLATNPYPRGTIRHDEWRRGWQIRKAEASRQNDDGYLAAESGLSLSENPHPSGTIRYVEWRRGWQLKIEETRRNARLARDRREPE